MRPYFYRWANTTQIAFRLTMQSVQVRYYCEQLVKAGQLVSERNPGWINRYSLPSLEGYCIKGRLFPSNPSGAGGSRIMKYPLLEKAGYSYSGIADAIREEGVNPHQLLSEINQCYQDAKTREEELENELSKVKSQRSYAVSSFIYTWKVLSPPAEILSFVQGNKVVVIKILDYDEMRIDYESIPIIIQEPMKLYEFEGSAFTKREAFGEKPDAIIGALGKSYFEEAGNTREALHEDFRQIAEAEDGYWCMTISTIPKIEVPYYYLVFDGKIQYRFDVLEFRRAKTMEFQREGYRRRFENKNWVFIGGQVIRAPADYLMRGFQGFRYTNIIF